MFEILKRYLTYNAHASSYTWKYESQVLDMHKTLTENGIDDDDQEFYTLRMREDQYLQSVILYYNDDLTEAWLAIIDWNCFLLAVFMEILFICTVKLINV